MKRDDYFAKETIDGVSQLPRGAMIPWQASQEPPGKLLRQHRMTRDEFMLVYDLLGREPTWAELGVFSAMWSEHCSYKSSRVHLKRLPTTGPNVVVGPGENAGVVRLSGKLCVAFKMESHNHPSYIDPFNGAATGVGGILRDVFCMGSRPVANLNCLRFGRRDHPKTRYLVEKVVKGIGDYGNCVGIPTVGGNIGFDACFDGNCLVNAMTVGVIHEDRIFKGYASGVGNLVVYVGSATGRDGIHGASMASDAFASKDEGERSAVQVGDPFAEKLVMEATLEVLEKGLVVGIQDMGAAGLTSSSFEMAGRAGNGLYMDLDRVPLRAQDMSAYEILLSESQERMVMVIEPDKWEPLRAVLEKWQLAHAIVGSVTGTGRVQIVHHGKLELDVPVEPLTDKAPKYSRPMHPAEITKNPKGIQEKVSAWIREKGQARVLINALGDTGSKLPVVRQYDHHIGNKTVLSSDEGGAAVIWLRSDWADPVDQAHLGLAISTACNERYCEADARMGAAHAVMKAARMIVAAGGEPLAVTDCLNFGNPERPEIMQQFSDAVDGISDACRCLDIPVVSGNVSLYNETDGTSIHPTPMIGMVGRVTDVRRALPAMGASGAALLLLTPRGHRARFGASLMAKQAGIPPAQGLPPVMDCESERGAMALIRDLSREGLLVGCRDVGDGGVLTTAAKMALAAGCGMDIAEWEATEKDMFGECPATYVLAAWLDHVVPILQKARTMASIRCEVLGRFAEGPSAIRWHGGEVPWTAAKSSWDESVSLG